MCWEVALQGKYDSAEITLHTTVHAKSGAAIYYGDAKGFHRAEHITDGHNAERRASGIG